ncbi:uncharacterized protein LOC134267782 isoform X2 [Saccostrea cucullata]|uniref:uncharacterized protein LOC134267782 isoform X2 n=1 Tax=Saccostrea cuccullata TaxID=36930 RepID=UPI002ED621BD
MKWKEAFTQQKNTSMLIWFWMILLVLREGFGIDQPYKVVNDTTTCQEIIKVTGYQTRLPCTGKDVRYHCLLDGNKTVEYEVCREWKWIPKGKCAYFNTYGSGNVDETDCESTPGLSCAVKEYNSADNTQYAACYVKKEMTTVPILETRVVDSSTGENSSLGQTPPTNSNQDEQSHPGSDIGITFGVLLPIIFMAAAVLLFKFGNLLEHCRTGSRENIDIEGHPCVNEKLLENNEEGEKKDENERNESTGNIPPTEEDKLLECNEEEKKQNVENKRKEDKTSTKPPEIVDSHSGSSIPNSEKALTQMSKNQRNECSDTGSTPVNGSSEITAQADDDIQGRKEVSIDIGESELSSITQGNVEKAKNESTEKDENQSNKTGNKDRDVKLHAIDNREGSLIPEQVISTSNQTPKSDINQEDSRDLQDDNKMSDCSTGGSGKEQGDSSEPKPDEKGSKKVTTAEDTGETSYSIQNNHENKNSVDPSNNLTEASVDQDGNLDACKPNPDSIVETDKKGEISLEKEDAGGVFDETLDSIKRKDDEEEGGSQDLHDFLEEVSTRLAKKMLYQVLKSHVTDLQSYLTDESKISKVKELLPTEYQSSVSIDSIKKSIPVMYAILQLSLDKGHQPKSGWGQEIKDRDTGVGDDVERLYRVHELYREIANPAQVSIDGYTRLFKVLFKAVDRLDVKGQCKEDYQEFVKKWENLQRNQWYKDNLKALQSIFKKWSPGSTN